MKILNIKDYGVQPNSQLLQTKEIQNVIDECHHLGGGEVQIPGGKYMIGSLRLYSNIKLHLLENAQLIGSENYKDYEDFHVPTTINYVHDKHYVELWNLPQYYIYGMICAFQETNVSIIGEKGSMINGQDCYDENGEEKFRGPMGIVLSQCQNIELKGYTFENCANWSHQIDSCQNIEIESVHIKAGHDGFDLHHCQNVHIHNCRLETGDDCFAGYNIEHLKVENCYINTACNALRVGGYDLVFDNCTFEGPGHYPHRSEDTFYTHSIFKYYAIRPDIINQDGGKIKICNSQFKDMTMMLSYQYGQESLMQNNKPLRELSFENCTIDGLSKKSFFKGNGESCCLIFKDVSFILEKGEEILEIDESIELILENISCHHQIVIIAPKESRIKQRHCQNIIVKES
ncbi:MAG: glycosyl hydrolase family 28 protein [Coprobacillus sp.]